MEVFIDETKGQTRGFCPDCSNITNHELLFSTSETLIHELSKKDFYEETILYNTIKCKGCDHISFAILSRSDDETNELGEVKYDYEYFPEYSDFDDFEQIDFLPELDVSKVPKVVRVPYEALIQVFSISEARILSGIALRLIIEAICMEQKIPGKNLKEKIDNMFNKGIISKNDLPILHSIREIGNVSAHEIKEPTGKVLDVALEIINHVLRTVYLMPVLHKKMTATKPKTNISKNTK